MIRTILATLFVVCLLPAAQAAGLSPDCGVTMPCEGYNNSSTRHHVRSHGRASTSLNGVTSVLADKVRSIQAMCPGTHIVSTIRHTVIAGSGGLISKHASGRAVDVRGNYACIYAQLRGWPSYSTDGPRCRHVHISVGETIFRHRRC